MAARVSRLGLGFGRSQRLPESLTASPCQAIPEKRRKGTKDKNMRRKMSNTILTTAKRSNGKNNS